MKKVTASPFRPALPVRPKRWMYFESQMLHDRESNSTQSKANQQKSHSQLICTIVNNSSEEQYVAVVSSAFDDAYISKAKANNNQCIKAELNYDAAIEKNNEVE